MNSTYQVYSRCVAQYAMCTYKSVGVSQNSKHTKSEEMNKKHKLKNYEINEKNDTQLNQCRVRLTPPRGAPRGSAAAAGSAESAQREGPERPSGSPI